MTIAYWDSGYWGGGFWGDGYWAGLGGATPATGITYPVSLPTGNIRSVRFRAVSVVGVSVSPFTFQAQAQAHAGQMWAVDVSLSPMTRAAASAWIAALLSLNGRYGTFYLGDPAGATPRGVATGTPLVDGAGQTGQTLATKGWTPTTTGILLRGDWIQLGTGTTQRIYRVIADVNSDASGDATLTIWPRLRVATTDSEAITTASTKGVFRLTHNDVFWDVDTALLYGIEFQAAEAL